MFTTEPFSMYINLNIWSFLSNSNHTPHVMMNHGDWEEKHFAEIINMGSMESLDLITNNVWTAKKGLITYMY